MASDSCVPSEQLPGHIVGLGQVLGSLEPPSRENLLLWDGLVPAELLVLCERGAAAAQGRNLLILGYFKENPQILEARQEQQHQQVSGDTWRVKLGLRGAQRSCLCCAQVYHGPAWRNPLRDLLPASSCEGS